jgi:hypothetical protein
MSSTSNAQDLLVNVFRPTYRWDSNTGFVPSLTVSNVTEIITGSVQTGRLAVTDSNLNTYIGRDAGCNATGTASNVGLGYSAMGGSLNSSNNVAVGVFSLDGLSNSDCNVALGARTDITGRGRQNVLIGPNVTMGDGSGNILIGVDISAGSVTKRFQLGTLLYGDLSFGYLGVNTTAPTRSFDVSGVTVFRGKVGFQNDNPVYSLDVNGSIGVSERFLGSNGSATVPLYSFGDSNASNSGLFVPTDASYGLGAIGVSIRGQTDVVIASNKTYIYNGLDVCGTITSSGGSASFLAGPGSVSEPAYSFSGTSNLGLYRTTDGSGSAVGIAIGGTSRFVVGSNKVTIFGNMDVCGAFSAVSGGGGSGGGTIAANGSAAAPSFTFSNDSTTGLFLQSASNLGFATAGVRRMTILNTGDVSAGRLVVSEYLRDTTNGTRTLDISGGNISNSGTSLAGTFETINALTTNRIGGVVLESSNVTNSGTTQSGTFFTMADTTSNQIAGVTLSNFDLCMSSAGRILGMTNVSNVIGGVTLSNTNISYAGTITGSTTNTSNRIGGVTLSNTNVLTGNGSFGSPAIGVGDASSGFYRPFANGLSASIAGVRVLQISSNLFEFSNRGVQTLWLTDNQLQASPGTVGTPGYAFAGDGSSGFYRVGASQVGFATAGSNRMTFSNANLGIGTAPAYPLDVLGQGHFQNASSNSGSILVGDPTTALLLLRDQAGNGYVRPQAAANLYLGTSNSNWVTLTNAGAVGIGVAAPVATLDICGAAGTPSLNLATWPRIPLSNALMVKGVPGAPVGNTLNFNTVVRTINSTLGTFVASNATSGGSLLINKAGIWSIMVVGSTGNGTQLWMDVSTNNHSNIGVYTNGNPVLAVAFTPGTGTSNNTTCTFMGYIPSNVYVKARINGSLGADGDIVWRMNALFHAETDTQTTWPF